MNLTSFRGVTFTTLGVTSPKFADSSSPSADRQPAVIARTGADPIITGVDAGARTMTFWFTPAVGQTMEPTFAKILALCNPDDPNEGTLVGTFLKTGPSTFVTVEAQAKVGAWSYLNNTTLAVDFILASPWREQSTTNLKTLAADTVNGNFANGNTGFRDALPIITTYWPASTQRSSSTATFGWKYRYRTFTLTNTGTEPWINQPYQIGPFGHSTLVGGGLALANGDDLRVFCEGKELRRNVIGANTSGCFIWVVLPTVMPGQSITLEIMSNNPSAGSPPTLTATSDPPLPAMDISGHSGTLTSSTTTTITQTGAGWDTDQWDGGSVLTNLGGVPEYRRINDNTATVLTVTRAFAAGPTGAYAVIKSGRMADGGIASAATSTSITDSAQSWGTNEWIGATVQWNTGANGQGTVSSNTATALTISVTSGGAPIAGVHFYVYRDNGVRMWDTRPVPKTTNHPGLWLTNKTQAPPTIVNFDAPGSWYRFAYAPSDDEYSQPRYASFLVGAGDYDHMPTMYLQRARKGKAGAQKEVGLADSVGVASPFPILGAYFGYTFRNAKKAGSGSPGEGMCEGRFQFQEPGGNNWAAFLSDVTVYNTNTVIAPAWYDLSTSTPGRIAMSLIPNGADQIPDADNNTALLQSSGNYVRIPVNSTASMTVTSVSNDVAVYDMNLIMRTGGASSTKPYHQIVIGGIDHRLFVTGTDERIVIDCEKHIATLQTAAGVILKRIPYGVQAQYLFADTDGTTRTVVAPRWLPIPSSAIDSTAIYFSDPSGAGWGSINIGVVAKLGYLT